MLKCIAHQILMSLVPQISHIQHRAHSAPGSVERRNSKSVRVSQISTVYWTSCGWNPTTRLFRLHERLQEIQAKSIPSVTQRMQATLFKGFIGRWVLPVLDDLACSPPESFQALDSLIVRPQWQIGAAYSCKDKIIIGQVEILEKFNDS